MDPLEQTVADTYSWAKERIDLLLFQEKYQEASDLYMEFKEWLSDHTADHEIVSLNI
jgi:hypothetical protein